MNLFIYTFVFVIIYADVLLKVVYINIINDYIYATGS